MKYYLGVDLGGTNIVAGVVDEHYNIIAKHREPTDTGRSFEDIVASIAHTAHKAVENASLTMQDIEGVGIGAPSCIDPKTNLLVNSNNFGWQNVPFPDELKKHFDRPLFIRNDADCAALGEALAGAAKDYDSAVMATLGTGVGGGVILNKRIFSGCDNMGAEIGHTKLVFHGEKCTCGQLGCLEAYASATALIRQAKEAARAQPDSLLNTLCGGDLENMEAKTAFDAMAQGDKTATEVIDRYISYLAAGLSSLVAIFRPEAIIIGGGVSNAGDVLLKPLNEKLFQSTYAATEIGVPPVVRAQLGNDAGIVGAAMLARSNQ
ncbi:MAG: ROK family glucokinase [Oscillospiraceae bacterium]|nr:ROK family glucokinase [Oscillospiraceae bacterium]